MNSKISVILPTYGRSTEIEGSINSIIKQTIEDIEIIIIDDNPSNSEEKEFIQSLVARLKRKNIDILHLKRDGKNGLASARNEGIWRASGDFIAFLDDDDRWEKEKLEKQLRALEDSEFDCCYTGRELVDDGSGHIVSPGEDITSLDTILRENIIGTPSSVMVKKSCLDELEGFDEGMDGAEEWEMWSRLVKKGCYFKALEEPLTIYSLDNDSMAGNSEIITPGREKFTEKYRNEIEQNENLASIHYLTRGIEQFEFNNFEKSKEYLLRSLEFRKTTWKAYLFLISIIIEKYLRLNLIGFLVTIKHRHLST